MCRQTDRQTQAGRHRQAEAGRQNTHTHTHTHTRRTHPSKQIHTQTHTDTHMHRSASLRAPLHCRYQHEPRVIEEANICVKWIIRCLGRYSIDLGQSASREPLSLAHSGAGKTKAGGGRGWKGEGVSGFGCQNPLPFLFLSSSFSRFPHPPLFCLSVQRHHCCLHHPACHLDAFSSPLELVILWCSWEHGACAIVAV